MTAAHLSGDQLGLHSAVVPIINREAQYHMIEGKSDVVGSMRRCIAKPRRLGSCRSTAYRAKAEWIPKSPDQKVSGIGRLMTLEMPERMALERRRRRDQECG
jgi:hypothetical protein